MRKVSCCAANPVRSRLQRKEIVYGRRELAGCSKAVSLRRDLLLQGMISFREEEALHWDLHRDTPPPPLPTLLQLALFLPGIPPSPPPSPLPLLQLAPLFCPVPRARLRAPQLGQP